MPVARRLIPLFCLLAAAFWLVASYRGGGLVFTLVQATSHSDRSLELVREYIARWGSLGPLVYVLLVVVEVMLAPIPGTLLYAPGGAVFGGGLGGTLSLAGNVIGATLACLVARLLERRVSRALDTKGLDRYRGLIVSRGGWFIFLLRLNPLTSSDLVSYAAGLVGVPAWKVALGTLAGMAPLCYAQAYLAERIFRVLPGSVWALIALGLTYFGAVVWIVGRGFKTAGAAVLEDSAVQENGGIILFDGTCAFCERSVVFIAKRDPGRYFRFGAAQSPQAAELLQRHGLTRDTARSIILIEGGRAYLRSTASLRIAGKLTFPWSLARIFLIVPVPVRDAVYRVVAAIRHRIAGTSNACEVPPPELRKRLI